MNTRQPLVCLAITAITASLVASCGGEDSADQARMTLRGTDCELPGDINGDGVVNSADLNLVGANWGSSDAAADLNADGAVDDADLEVVRAHWLEQCTAGPTLVSPAHGAQLDANSLGFGVLLTWEPVPGAVSYEFKLFEESQPSSFHDLYYDQTYPAERTLAIVPLGRGLQWRGYRYEWRVRAVFAEGRTSSWSASQYVMPKPDARFRCRRDYVPAGSGIMFVPEVERECVLRLKYELNSKTDEGEPTFADEVREFRCTIPADSLECSVSDPDPPANYVDFTAAETFTAKEMFALLDEESPEVKAGCEYADQYPLYNDYYFFHRFVCASRF